MCEKAYTMSLVKILRKFEMRRDVANEALANNGWCEKEGKGGCSAERFHREGTATVKFSWPHVCQFF